MYTVMSFLNTTKYPVSLMYTLMTLGPVLVMLSLMEKIKWASLLKPFEVFGRVPMLYYILHFYIIHAVAIFLFMNKTGKSLSELDFHFNQTFGGLTLDAGYSLAWTYFAWISLVIFLYPVCKWYNKYKSTHTNWWLSYI
jgi:predicted acyltransferase